MGQNLFTVQLIEGTSSRPLASELDIFTSGVSVVVVEPLLYFLEHMKMIRGIHTYMVQTVPCLHPSYQRMCLVVAVGIADP